MIINENSLTCATVNPTIIPFLDLYHNMPIKIITINGFPINTNNENTMIGTMLLLISVNTSCDHKNTKNKSMKKSLNDLTFPAISNLYGNAANVNHAISAPISSEKPINSILAAPIKHRAIANMSKNSVDFAILVRIFGNI